ncbi:KR domain-containing protein [Streptomyces sp. M19]
MAACDVRDRDAVAGLLASLDRPLGVVVHAAGVLDDGVLGAQTPSGSTASSRRRSRARCTWTS